MLKPLSVFIGLRYVRSRQSKGFSSFISASSTIGIAIGVMVLIVVMSAMNGFERALATHLLSIVPHGEIVAVTDPIENWPNKIARIQQHSSVMTAAPFIKTQGMMQKSAALKGVEIRGVDVMLEPQVSAISNYMVAGKWQDLARENAIIIGAGIARKLSVQVGDKVQLLLPPVSMTDQQGSKAQQFPVPMKQQASIVGIFKFGGTIDDTQAFINLAKASELQGYQAGEVQGIRLKVADVFTAPQVIRDVAYNFDFYVYMLDWTRSHGHLFNDIQLVFEQKEHPENLIEHPMCKNMAEKAREYFQENPNEILSVDENGTNMLQREEIAGNKTTIDILLELGADKDTKNNKGKTAFDYAKELNWEHIIPVLE